jgi:hypothetical protein
MLSEISLPAILLLVLAGPALAQTPQPHTQPPSHVITSSPQALALPPQVVQQTRQLLEWLGVLGLLDQAPATLAMSLEAEAKFLQASPQQREEWRRELEPQLQPAQLQKALIQYVAERYKPDTFQRAEELLQQPLAKRARFFDLAMTQTTAVPGLKAYRAQLQTAPQASRRAIVQELDAASATSLMVAILQTGVGERVRRSADTGAETDPQERLSSITQEFVERQRFLAPLTEDYLLYAYRYFKDEELIALRDLMRDAELQWLLDVSRQGLIATLLGEGNT